MAFASHLLLFRIDQQLYVLPVDCIREVLHKAELVCAPGQPSILDGFLNLRGAVLPVIRLRRLFNLPPAEPGVYTPLVITEAGGMRAALEVDEVREVVPFPSGALRPLEEGSSPNRCAEGLLTVDGADVILLSCERILLTREKECVRELQFVVQERLRELESFAE